MITTTLGALVDAESALRRVCGLPLRSKEIPDGLAPKTRYHLAKLARLVAAETKHLADERIVIFKALGLHEGQAIKDVPPSVWEAYQQQIREYVAVAVTLELDPVRSSDLSLALAADLVELGPLCDLVEPEEPK